MLNNDKSVGKCLHVKICLRKDRSDGIVHTLSNLVIKTSSLSYNTQSSVKRRSVWDHRREKMKLK